MARRLVWIAVGTVLSVSRASAAPVFDPALWLQDLQVMREALAAKYANFDWAVFEREADLSQLFEQTRGRIARASSAAEARAAIDRLTRRLGDGHVVVDWPAPATSAEAAATPPQSRDVCRELGYDGHKNGEALGPHIPGYRPLPDDTAAQFPAGLIAAGGRRIGVLRIGLFSPEGSPALCNLLLKRLSIRPDGDCDQACASKVEDAAYTQLSRDLAARIRALGRAGATALMIDLTGNGGGSEWAEAAARLISRKPLTSEHVGFVRGEHWSRRWGTLAADLRTAATKASPSDRVQLLAWAGQVDRAQTEAKTPCSSEPYWHGQKPGCEWLGRAFYATGVLGKGDAVALRKKSWGSLVFSPAEFEFEQGVWRGPLLILVDQDTASAAEEFTAVLQDNGAALVIGAPTAGAGCGHTAGGTPTALPNSGGVLQVPDCARFRRDGTNEVSGIQPDVLIGFRETDGLRRKGLRVAAALPRAFRAPGK